MLKLEVGEKYKFTLKNGNAVGIVVHGTKPAPNGLDVLDIEVDGVRGTYFDVNAALGHLSYVKVEN